MSKKRLIHETDGDLLPVDRALRTGRLLQPRPDEDRDSRGLSVTSFITEGSNPGWKRHLGSRAYTPGRSELEDELHDD